VWSSSAGAVATVVGAWGNPSFGCGLRAGCCRHLPVAEGHTPSPCPTPLLASPGPRRLPGCGGGERPAGLWWLVHTGAALQRSGPRWERFAVVVLGLQVRDVVLDGGVGEVGEAARCAGCPG